MHKGGAEKNGSTICGICVCICGKENPLFVLVASKTKIAFAWFYGDAA